MKHFLIITNSFKDKELALTGKLKDYICRKNGTASCYYSTGETLAAAAPGLSEIPEGTDGILVLGGDGTLIRAASRLVETHIPLIGVNLGTLGYLCELEEQSLFQAIDRLMAGDYIVEQRMMLEGYGQRAGGAILAGTAEAGQEPALTAGGIALNDVVIHRAGALSVVSLDVYVNGEYLSNFCADGMILATPTGSTGYNMSAGGPIVDPKAGMLLITPINAHNMNSRSIVVGAEDEVVVEIAKRRSQQDELVEVSYDGDGAGQLFVGDRLIVRRAKETVRICKLSRKSFLELLGRKMQAYT